MMNPGNGYPTSPGEKPLAFVDSADVATVNGDSGGGADVPAPLPAGVGPYNLPRLEGLPTYAQILSSDDGVTQKISQVYTVSRVRLQHQFASVQPWGEFLDWNFFAAPQGTTDVINRLNRNISHFYSNYIILSLACSSYVLFINLFFSLCVFAIAFTYFYVRNRSLAMSEDAASDGLIYIGATGMSPMQLYLGMLIFGAVTFYLTSGSSVVFWLVLTSIGVTCGHAAMRRPPLEERSAFQLA